MKRGHKVTLFGIPEAEELVSRTSLGFQVIGTSELPIGVTQAVNARFGKLTGTQALRFYLKFLVRQSGMIFRDAPGAIRSAEVDLLLVDQIILAGGTVADYLNLPFVTICSALPIHMEADVPPYFTHWRNENTWWAKGRNQLGNLLFYCATKSYLDVVRRQRKRWHLPPHEHVEGFNSRLAILAQLPQELDFPRKNIEPWFHYTGPLKNPSDVEPISKDDQAFSMEALNGKPVIYATLGTAQSCNWGIFRCIAEACLDIDAQLVISLGNPRANPAETNFPGNPMVLAFPPHQKLINRAHLVITHAGSSAVSCLSSGVPVVAIPLAADQPGMAARVAQAGAGEVVPLAKLNAHTLRAAIKQVFEGAGYRKHAERLRFAIRVAGGLGQAANIVEQVIETKAPVLTDRKLLLESASRAT